MRLSCDDFDPSSHCSSCHQDDEMGYGMCEIEPPRKKYKESKLYAEVCCDLVKARPTRDDWAKAIRKRKNGNNISL